MPIEIKELSIKINLEETPKFKENKQISDLSIKKLKDDIIRSCTNNVIDYFNEKQER